MNIKSTIDQLFKDQLNELPVAQKEALWEQMEKKLDAQGDKKKDKSRYLLLLLFLVAGGVITFLSLQNNSNGTNAVSENQNNQHTTAGKPADNKDFSNSPQKQNIDEKKSAVTSTSGKTSGGDIVITYNGHRQVNGVVKNKQKKSSRSQGNSAVVVNPGDTDEISEAVVVNEAEKASSQAVPKETGSIKTETVVAEDTKQIKSPQQPSEEKNNAAVVKTTKDKLAPAFGISGGMDVFLKAKEAGGYAGIQLTIPVNKKVNIVTGALISKHKMEENYSNAAKQLINPDKNIDAKLEGLTVLQVPILYEQPLPKTSVRFRVGLTPTYIIAAGIYNVPNSFTGNAANYRKFTLDDLHRLNVLFTASVGVGIMKHFEVELKGNYGLTELVKNSYINQSSVNNNFKSAQVGLIYKFGKK